MKKIFLVMLVLCSLLLSTFASATLLKITGRQTSQPTPITSTSASLPSCMTGNLCRNIALKPDGTPQQNGGRLYCDGYKTSYPIDKFTPAQVSSVPLCTHYSTGKSKCNGDGSTTIFCDWMPRRTVSSDTAQPTTQCVKGWMCKDAKSLEYNTCSIGVSITKPCPYGCSNNQCNPAPAQIVLNCVQGLKCKDVNTLGYQFSNCDWDISSIVCAYGCSIDRCNKLFTPGKCANSVGYKCKDANTMVFQDPNCDLRISSDTCTYGCSNNQCNPAPVSQQQSTTQCVRGWKCKDANTYAYQYPNCDWYKTQTRCQYGCLNGVCKQRR